MTSDFLILAVIIAFFGIFGYLGIVALKKKRKERYAELLAALPADDEKAHAPVVEEKSLGLALAATRKGIIGRIADIFGQRPNHQAALQELERVLLTADIGVHTAQKLLNAAQGASGNHENALESIKFALKEESLRLLEQCKGHGKPICADEHSPCVVMFVGVNGVGKTTTIGKIAEQLRQSGKKVLLGAGDTFRAAASEQLGIWAKRTGVDIFEGASGADPASVLFDAVSKGKAEGYDVVLCDTAGRLHTKSNLMDELKKAHRVLGKAVPNSPHEVLLVLDASTGQNALLQAKQFQTDIALTGLVLTKLDGTAKGGVVLGIVDQLQVPIRYIGVGEGVSDLRLFDSKEFVDALFQ